MIFRPFKSIVKKSLQSLGYDIVPYTAYFCFELRRHKLLEHLNVSCTFDVGANVGAYASLLRHYGYKGQIVSFEPSAEAFSRLESKCAQDPNWECRNIALGDTTGSAILHVAKNSVSSSLLPPTETQLRHEPKAAAKSDETIQIVRLDEIKSELVSDDQNLFMKIDVQGAELQVLEGCTSHLHEFALLEIELGLISFYEGQPDYLDVIEFLKARRFDMVGIGPNTVSEETGLTYEVNAIFKRRENSTFCTEA